MSVVAPGRFAFDHSFVRDLDGLYVTWQAAPAPDPRLVVLNEDLAGELGLDVGWLRSSAGVAVLAGNDVPEGAQPVAMAYAGHQFGGFSPRLGDGRALLVGEFVDPRGRRFDLHLKGSGRTPFARGGDGKAALGPMLREYVIGEAMHALGIPTNRALGVVTTGESIVRDGGVLPGAVLARVAASHVRVGTFQYAAREVEVLCRLVDHAVARHHPQAASAEQPVLAFYEAVVEAQAALVARWMHVGFIHGVMNTDNMTISGETIDYGPCAFMDAYDPATVFSSIDHGGRYAYGNQPGIAAWNLARLGETLLPLLADDQEAAVAAATEVLQTFPARYHSHWTAGMRVKLGLSTERAGDGELAEALLAVLHGAWADFTSAFRALASSLRGDDSAWTLLVGHGEAPARWNEQWRERLALEGRDPVAVAGTMDAVNPRYVPRNHHVEAALAAATAGDLGPFERLVEVVRHPFVERSEWADYAGPAPDGFGPYRTFCGT